MHKLTGRDKWFIQLHRCDPLIHSDFAIGDKIVICENCKCVQLWETWEYDKGLSSRHGNDCIQCGCTSFTDELTIESISHQKKRDGKSIKGFKVITEDSVNTSNNRFTISKQLDMLFDSTLDKMSNVYLIINILSIIGVVVLFLLQRFDISYQGDILDAFSFIYYVFYLILILIGIIPIIFSLFLYSYNRKNSFLKKIIKTNNRFSFFIILFNCFVYNLVTIVYGGSKAEMWTKEMLYIISKILCWAGGAFIIEGLITGFVTLIASLGKKGDIEELKGLMAGCVISAIVFLVLAGALIKFFS